jgi:hypothetical protein
MLSKSLKTDLSDLGTLLQAHGRGKDRVLAHITPKEAALLKARGGRGSRNPKTGLLEFDDTPVVNDPGLEPVVVSAPYISQPDISGSTSALYTPPPSPAQPAANPPPAKAAAQDTSNADLAPVQVTPQTPLPTNYNPPSPPVEPVIVHGQASSAPPPTAGDTAALVQSGTGGGNTAPSFGTKVTNYLTDPGHLLELGGLGALGYLGLSNANKSSTQAAQQQQQLAALAQPFQQVGQQALDATTAGNLTPQNAAALEAARAQIGQSVAGGGVSAEQGAEKISTVFASLLQDQLNQAVQLLQVADNYTQAAINAGYQTTQAGQTATANFFQNLAQIATKVL